MICDVTQWHALLWLVPMREISREISVTSINCMTLFHTGDTYIYICNDTSVQQNHSYIDQTVSNKEAYSTLCKLVFTSVSESVHRSLVYAMVTMATDKRYHDDRQ